jgi:O-antigen/teichoic acid export membrane protein
LRSRAILFSPNYAAYSDVFVRLVAAAAVSCAARPLIVGITSARWFRIQVPMFALAAGSNALVYAWLVPRSGLAGAATAVVISLAAQFVIATSVLFYLVSSEARRVADDGIRPEYRDPWEPGL